MRSKTVHRKAERLTYIQMTAWKSVSRAFKISPDFILQNETLIDSILLTMRSDNLATQSPLPYVEGQWLKGLYLGYLRNTLLKASQ